MSSFLFKKRLSLAISFILTASKALTGILGTFSWKNPKVISLVSLSPLVIIGLFIRNDSFKLPSIKLYSCRKSEKLCEIPFKIGFLFSSIAAHQVVLAGLPLNPSPLKQVVDSPVWLSWHHFLLKHNLPSSAEFPPHSEVKLEQKRLLSMFFNSN